MAGGGKGSEGALSGAFGNAITAPGSVGATADMPTWQKGLMGAMTGNLAYGQNAPAINGLMQAALKAQQGAPAPMVQRPPMQGMQGMPPAPGMAPGPGVPSAPPGLGMSAPGMGMAPGGAPQGQINPQMLAMLRAQYPTMFGGM